MIAHLIVTVIAEDRPGVLEILADAITKQGGNWLESQLLHLHNQFSGIVAVAVNREDLADLQQALDGLTQQGFCINYRCTDAKPGGQGAKPFKLTVVGPDRPGIVREVARALAQHGINLTELSSECSSMPWSGEPMFTARGKALMPAEVNLAELDEALDQIAEELGLDIALEDREEA